MSSVIDTLEKSVCAATALISQLRNRVARLEQDLATSNTHLRSTAAQPPPAPAGSADAGELERLRAERSVIRERIRELLREIDRVHR